MKISSVSRGRAEPLQHDQDARVLHVRAQHPVQVRVDLREQAAEPVRLGDQVVVESDE
ncbi:hypothetical protein [Streptomyces kanamyceticus]|uniref:hypothetical protein n=1 Tax=Streptomyces kanamyceticus TaxID=1967 RepID=UPI0012FEB3BE|nr:hypothetical protein [Streptomyces kanamyceticus]